MSLKTSILVKSDQIGRVMTDLKDFATPIQLEYMGALKEHGTIRKAAKALGKNNTTLSRSLNCLAKKVQDATGIDPDIFMLECRKSSLVLKQTQALKDAGLDIDIPEGMPLERLTMTGKVVDGKFQIDRAWPKAKQEALAREDMVEKLREGMKDIPKVYKVPKPKKMIKATTNYIVGDHHHGMRAWFKEVLANWDLKISESYFKTALLDLMSMAPDTEEGHLIILGDFFHTDNMDGVTARNRHILDNDTRLPKMYSTGQAMLKWAIEQLRAKHKRVVFSYCFGNHDEVLAITSVDAFTMYYEDIKDVEIKPNWRYFIPHSYGGNFFLIHHGHKTAMAKTYQVAIRDHKQELLTTKYHYGYTGHIHSEKKYDNGMLTESFRVLPPGDKYGHDGGYCAGRQMEARVYMESSGLRATYISNGE